MQYRVLGKTGFTVSTVSLGAWAIGGSWGQVDDEASMRALHRALDLGVNFFDTADVYGDGHSERLLARLRRERSDPFIVATKAGRRLDPHVAEGYSADNLTVFVERSLRNLEAEVLDLVQLHCPPTDVYYRPAVFAAMDDLVAAGKVRWYGVSVERVEEGLKAIEYPGVASVQVIYNLLRQRPADLLFAEAARRDVGLLARLPLSSGMLTGRLSAESTFADDDHRAFNRHGEAFDKGETFSGLDYTTGLAAVEELRALVPVGMTLAQFALRWLLMAPDLTCAIPGGRTAAQVDENMAAADLPPLAPEVMTRARAIYETMVRSHVHHSW